ncbi:MAG: DUF2059 domain-containing protein [Geothrix sp.]|uniref:DUF2059 domain-containing protein n=1 Tax=Geothrix sp. TaxID=1962974 RepID=UPI001798053E|nr:DUF2059 domain-containing protein [Geothrix sp.]NWJ41288.1 DUF2059 domain-containing protein [Geothrix sp.]WIL20722.1 MAG: DUF2059 domain-containing protein [Geothrix sp.]
MPSPRTRAALLFALAPCLLAQAPEPQSGLDLAQEVIEAYGAKQRFSAAIQGQLQTFKAQNPNLPGAQIEAFAREVTKDELYVRLARTLEAAFTVDELKALLVHFRSNGCRKAFNDPALDPKTLTPEDRLDIDRFLKSPVGVKFSGEWPRLKQAFADIGRQWVTDALERVRQAPAKKSGHH